LGASASKRNTLNKAPRVNSLFRLLQAICCLLALSLAPCTSFALEAGLLVKSATGDSDERVKAIEQLAASGDAAANQWLQALLDGEARVTEDSAFILKEGKAVNVATGSVAPLPPNAQEVINNNRMRNEIEAALSGLQLFSADSRIRLSAAKSLEVKADQDKLPLVQKALAKESDAQIRLVLAQVEAALLLTHNDATKRIAAANQLGESASPSARTLLLSRLVKDGANWQEADEAVRAKLQVALGKVENRLAWAERLGAIFSGISLGSVLLLAALGLAITYGLMGVINMAHGELMMIGAYTTYVVQVLFKSYAPQYQFLYLLVAIPSAFVVAAAIGMVLERTVIRWLYGRPLETLLATWGISLLLIQTVRQLFGAQNVAVENPSWLSGGVTVLSSVVLPYNRIAIIAFALLVLLAMSLVLTRTRLGLYVRAVTQNRGMAASVGVPTARVDMLAFGLGSGVAGLAGCALSQLGNVGPDLGQTYIVDCFMVVVLGGVGQLAGTVYAALGLGIVGKFLEGMTGAVLAKIMVLVFIILFIQKRPQGLFALKGRSAEA
jgi:urea transport system permease protein